MASQLQHIAVAILTVFFLSNTFGQNTTTINFYEQIKNYDLSTILIADSFLAEDREYGKDRIKRAEILGFIGDNYQRFQIHFISVIQNPTDPYEYLAYGKTKVKETICTFQGKITLKQAKTYKSNDIPAYQQGYTTCDVILYEDNKQPFTGFVKGKLTSHFVIDNQGTFRYDGTNFVADGFSNNEFIGTWTSYKSNVSKRCNWGDYTIPESGDLDIGAGEFSVDEKYVRNGWVNYMLENMAADLEIKRDKTNTEQKNWWE